MRTDAAAESHARGGEGLFLVWIVDDRDTVVVRAAATLSAVMDAARAYCAGWGGVLRYVEGPDGEVLPRALWEPLMLDDGPLPYMYTVELRSPRSAGRAELITVLWTKPSSTKRCGGAHCSRPPCAAAP